MVSAIAAKKPEAVAPAAKQPKEIINNTRLVEDFRKDGGRIVHRRPKGNRRGVTFAFRVKGGRIEIATSVTHRNDCFSKKVGTKLAIEHFRKGQTIFLPMLEKNYVTSIVQMLGVRL